MAEIVLGLLTALSVTALTIMGLMVYALLSD